MNRLEYAAYAAADVFNKTALGMGVLVAGYLLYTGYYLRAFGIIFILVPLYFWLYDRFGGMPTDDSDPTESSSNHGEK